MSIADRHLSYIFSDMDFYRLNPTDGVYTFRISSDELLRQKPVAYTNGIPDVKIK